MFYIHCSTYSVIHFQIESVICVLLEHSAMHSFSIIGYISFNWASARAMNADMVWYSCEHSSVDLTTCYNDICKHWLLVPKKMCKYKTRTIENIRGQTS